MNQYFFNIFLIHLINRTSFQSKYLFVFCTLPFFSIFFTFYSQLFQSTYIKNATHHWVNILERYCASYLFTIPSMARGVYSKGPPKCSIHVSIWEVRGRDSRAFNLLNASCLYQRFKIPTRFFF